MTLSTGTRLGRLEILALLGAGGMGEIYRAHDPRLGRDVAIELLAPHLAVTSEARARFKREAQTISQLDHPHICTLHDMGREGDMDETVLAVDVRAGTIFEAGTPAVLFTIALTPPSGDCTQAAPTLLPDRG